MDLCAKRLVDHERGLLGLQCWLYQAAKVPSTTTWWDFNYVVYGLILAPPSVVILCGPNVDRGIYPELQPWVLQTSHKFCGAALNRCVLRVLFMICNAHFS